MHDVVEVKGVKQKEYFYYAYNKPKDVETNSPREDLFPLGRLDKNSHGLLILTNDGRITDTLLNPKYYHEKEYLVRTKEKLRSNFKQKMEAGVKIEGYTTKPCKVQIVNENTFRIILTEGKNKQIRRMCKTFGYFVERLVRVRIANIELEDLQPGEYREFKFRAQ